MSLCISTLPISLQLYKLSNGTIRPTWNFPCIPNFSNYRYLRNKQFKIQHSSMQRRTYVLQTKHRISVIRALKRKMGKCTRVRTLFLSRDVSSSKCITYPVPTFSEMKNDVKRYFTRDRSNLGENFRKL